MKALLCYALALLFFLPTAQAQYGHPGADLPERAVMMNLAPQQSWIVFFCPDDASCEAHVVCYHRGTSVTLDPLSIEPKQAGRIDLYRALRGVAFTEAAT